MIEFESMEDPGEEPDTWADYQSTSAKRDLVEAVAELCQLNIGNALTLIGRASRYVRIAMGNRQEASRRRAVAMEEAKQRAGAGCTN